MYTINTYGIPIKICCASCKHCDHSRASPPRLCLRYGCVISRCRQGRDWQMSKAMKAVGKGNGKIKRKEYLRYLLQTRQDEEQSGKRPKGITQIRKDFEKQFGDMYYNV